MENLTEGLRYNAGKTRHDLVPAFAQEQYARVLTKGAEKYAERNWEKGMPWSKVFSSLERHLLSFKNGEDRDPETGELHTAHIMCNAAFLTEYYKIFPQGDDRPHSYLSTVKIGLDIDEVLADFTGAYSAAFNCPAPTAWNFDRLMKERFERLTENRDFWLKLPAKVKPAELQFEPACYITSRIIPTGWTEEWLDSHGFPVAPVHTVGTGVSKVKAALHEGIDWFVDDRYETFAEMNKAGVFCWLFDAPHNQRYNVGFRRIKNLNELVK